MDVFGKLNDFLNNEEESFKYESIETEDSQTINERKSPDSQKEQSSQNTQKKSESQQLKPRRSKRGRPANSQNSNSSTEDVLDLTLGYEGPMRAGKSRRKLADKIPIHIEEQIDLCDIVSPVLSPNVQNVRGKRGAKKPKGTRKISYKKALEIIKKPVTMDIQPSKSKEKLPVGRSTAAPQNPSRRSQDGTVDLTGDVVMSDFHNKNPLFQKSTSSPSSVKKKKHYECQNLSLDIDDDLDMTSINIKVKGNIRKYRIRSSQHFYELFKMIAEDEDIPMSSVVCLHGEKRIYPEETLDSIGHRVSNIYTCRMMDPKSNMPINKKDQIEIKFQSDKWKKPIAMSVSRFESFKYLIEMLCEKVGYKPEQFSLSFDGDGFDMKKSPIELEFEGGEIVDCRIKG